MRIEKRVILNGVPVLYKRPKDEQEVGFLRLHHDCLLKLEGTGVAPESFLFPNVEYGVGDLWPEEDLGTNQTITIDNEVEFSRGCVRLLSELHSKGIHHADLTYYNVIVKNNRPYAIDFHESQFFGDDTPPKRPEGDAYWMWESADHFSLDSTRRIRRWRAIRPYLVPNTSLIDFGTSMGDFLAMAEVEYMGLDVKGYENNAQENWDSRQQHKNIVQSDIVELLNYKCHTALFMSVYPHIVNASGEFLADRTLRNIIEGSTQCFFETQLLGDGIGDVPKFENDGAVLSLLRSITDKQIEPIVTIPVHGREPCVRTVWRIH